MSEHASDDLEPEPLFGVTPDPAQAIPEERKLEGLTVPKLPALKTRNRPRDENHLPASVNPATQLVKAQWERAQKDLQREKLSHKRDAEQAAVKLAELNNALREANDARFPEKRRWNKQILIQTAVGLAATLVISGIVFFAATHWKHLQSIAITEFPQEEMPTRTPTASNTIQPAQKPLGTSPGASVGKAGAVTPPTSDFTQGVSRLSEAFSRFPGVEPEDVMRTVNQKTADGPTPCPFNWKDGQPALQFGNKDAGNKDASVAGSLSRCSDAVEKLPAPR